MAKSNEPIFWSLFSAGGVVAAFFIPVTMILTGIAVPLGWTTAESLRGLVVTNPLVKIYLFVAISLPLFHWAHRFRYAVADLGLKRFGSLLAVGCYGAAAAATALTAVLLVGLRTLQFSG